MPPAGARPPQCVSAFELATVAEEAQVEIERVRQTKVALVNRASAQLRHEGAGLLSAGERAALAFAGKAEVLMACECYERRAISRRDRRCGRWQSSKENYRGRRRPKLSGPPRPKSSLTRHLPLREDVLPLQVGKVMGSSPGPNFSSTYEWQPSKSMYGSQPGRSRVGVYITTVGDRDALEKPEVRR